MQAKTLDPSVRLAMSSAATALNRLRMSASSSTVRRPSPSREKTRDTLRSSTFWLSRRRAPGGSTYTHRLPCGRNERSTSSPGLPDEPGVVDAEQDAAGCEDGARDPDRVGPVVLEAAGGVDVVVSESRRIWFFHRARG